MPSSTEQLPSPSPFHIAIIGGGIGGLTTALSLATHNPNLNLKHITITVYEQAPAYKEIGAGIGIGVNAGRILRKLGVYDQANAISGERNGVHRSLRRWDNGEEIVSVGAMDEEDDKNHQTDSNGAGGVRQLSVHRAEFLDVLYREIRRRGCAELMTGKKAERVEDNGSTVTIHFADNTTATAHLVIACDGIHSSIRTQFAIDQPRYSGRIAYRGLLPLSAVAEKWPYPSYAVSWLAPNKHFLVFPISQNKILNVVAFVTKPEAELGDLRESWTSSAPREEVETEYAGWEPTVQNIIKNMEPYPGKWKLNDRELLEKWCYMDGKVVLSGDAAHAMLPHQGSGAGHAIEDAYILGLAVKSFLDNNPNPSSAGSAGSAAAKLSTYTTLYEAMRRPRTHKAQITSRQAGDVYEMQGPDFEGLSSYEECLPVVREKMKSRMRWVWGHDLDREFEEVKRDAGLGG